MTNCCVSNFDSLNQNKAGTETPDKNRGKLCRGKHLLALASLPPEEISGQVGFLIINIHWIFIAAHHSVTSRLWWFLTLTKYHLILRLPFIFWLNLSISALKILALAVANWQSHPLAVLYVDKTHWVFSATHHFVHALNLKNSAQNLIRHLKH